MRKLSYVLPSIIGFVVTTLVAAWLAGWVQADACLDAAGSIDSATGFCETAPGTQYIEPFARPGNVPFWTAFLGASLLPGVAVAGVVTYLLRRSRSRE